MSQRSTEPIDERTCCRQRLRLPPPALFKALADRNRQAIVSWLALGRRPQSVSQISRCCDVDLSVVSRHLARLREVGIVTAARKGKEVRYSLRLAALARVLRETAAALEACHEGPAARGG